MGERMTRSAFARFMSVHRSQVTRWGQAGMPVRDDGTMNVAECEAWVSRHVDPVRRVMRHSYTRSGRPVREDPADTFARLALWLFAQRIPAMVASAAVEVGVSVPLARALHELLLDRAAELADEMRELCSIPAGEMGPFERITVEHPPVDWAELARHAATLSKPEATAACPLRE